MAELHKILKQYWGFGSFRPLQEDIINSVLSGNDTLALLPTGGGKSLCYQVPALAKGGLCLVISPLIALMKDQVESLRKKNITAYSIYSGMSRKEVIQTLQTVINSNCKFLYVSPERLETSLFKEYLPGIHVNLIAVDEAHCISQWGYDFRPPYLRISALREELPGVPVLALTASATPDVQKDICDKLSALIRPPQTPPKEGLSKTPKNEESFNHWKIFRQSFERPNLSYSVFRVDSRINKMIEILKKVPGTGIVYCKTRKRTKEISELLQLQNISADFYHAGLPQEERNRKQEEWISNKTRIIVCTNAFGMGIDKPDVRVVVHADVPDCLENYYQEAGRAGRDGKTSFAVLLHDGPELEEMEAMIDQRFPSQKNIQETYQAIANYLQIPSGAREGDYYDFDFSDFLKKFKLNNHTALYSLKALEQEGWMAFNEQVFRPSSVQFTINKDALYSFEKKHPQLEPLIKTLLRAHEGIFDQVTLVSELFIAKLMKKDAEEIKKQLTLLHKAGVIEYVPRKDSPQLFLLRPRIRAENLSVDTKAYMLRKEKFRARIKEMIRFVKEDVQCRSHIIGSYFGDGNIKPCGICDNCLRRKQVKLNKEEFEKIYTRIMSIAADHPVPVKELLQKLSDIKKEKAWKVIEFLQSENKIRIDNNSRVIVSLPVS